MKREEVPELFRVLNGTRLREYLEGLREVELSRLLAVAAPDMLFRAQGAVRVVDDLLKLLEQSQRH